MTRKNTKNSKSYFREKIMISLSNNRYIHEHLSLQSYDKKSISSKPLIALLIVFTVTVAATINSDFHNMNNDSEPYLSSHIMSLPQVYAEEFVSTYAEDKVTWQLLYLSNDSGCKNAYYQRMNLYDEIAEKYMDMYGFHNTKYDNPQCMSVFLFNEKYDVPEDLELLIVVLDEDLGERELSRYNMGGLYHYDSASNDAIVKKNNALTEYRQHLIVICDCGSFKFSEPVWLLSHEMSHFILNYLGYPKEIADEKIHYDDLKYDQCIDDLSGSKYDSDCRDSIKTSIRANAYNYSVMKPFPDAVNMKFYSPDIEQKEQEKRLEIIDKWWKEGRIDSKMYQQLKTEIMNSNKIEREDRAKMFKDPPRGELESSLYGKTAIQNEKKGNHINSILDKYSNTSYLDSVTLELEDIKLELGTTNTKVSDVRINANSSVQFRILDDDNDHYSETKCNGAIVDVGEFYVQCDTKLENVTITYKIIN